jgi:excisionase family DNA binding protein
MDLQTEQSIKPTIERPNLQLLTAVQAAELLNIHPSTVYEMMKNGEIATVRFGRSVRIRRQDLEDFIRSHLERLGG